MFPVFLALAFWIRLDIVAPYKVSDVFNRWAAPVGVYDVWCKNQCWSVSWVSAFSEETHIWKKHYAAQCKVTHMSTHTYTRTLVLFCFSKPCLFRGGVSGTLDQWTLHPHMERGRCWQVRSVSTEHALLQKFKSPASSVCVLILEEKISFITIFTDTHVTCHSSVTFTNMTSVMKPVPYLICELQQSWKLSVNNGFNFGLSSHELYSAAVMAYFCRPIQK